MLVPHFFLSLLCFSNLNNVSPTNSSCQTLGRFWFQAWELWTNGKVLELLDPVLQVHGSSACPERYIAIGLLCVQESPADRPAMSEVVSMLSNDQATLTSPKQPAFTVGRTVVLNAAGEVQLCSANKLTDSVMEPR